MSGLWWLHIYKLQRTYILHYSRFIYKTLMVYSKYLLSYCPAMQPVPTRLAHCLQSLESSGSPPGFDRNLAALARLQSLTQEACRSLGRFEPVSRVRVFHAGVQMTVGATEKQLVAIMSNIAQSSFGSEFSTLSNFVLTDSNSLSENHFSRMCSALERNCAPRRFRCSRFPPTILSYFHTTKKI